MLDTSCDCFGHVISRDTYEGVESALPIADDNANDIYKACEQQQACRKAASMLTEELDAFYSLSDRVRIIQEREESRRALGEMMIVIAEAANYISGHTSTKLIGILFLNVARHYAHQFAVR